MAIKLDPVERMEIIGELGVRTNYSFEYLNSLPDDKLVSLLKEKK